MSKSISRWAWGAVTVLGVGLAVAARVADAAEGPARALGVAAAVVLCGRVAMAVWLASRGRLYWTRLPLLILIAGEAALYGLDVPFEGLALRALLGLFEVGALGYAIAVSLRGPRPEGSLPEDCLAAALSRVFPDRVARVLALECIILGSLFPARRRAMEGKTFGYTAESFFRLLVLSFPALIVGDFFLVHTLVPREWLAVHVAHAALTAYGIVWLIGLYRTMLLRPHTVEGGILRLHRGVLATASIPLGTIASVESVEDGAKVEGRPARFDLKGAPRFLVALREPAAVRGFLGTKGADRILVSADDPAALRAALASSK